jgi:hypothetical protein
MMMKKFYEETEECLIDKTDVINLLNNEEFKQELGTEYMHIKNHYDSSCLRCASIEKEDDEKNTFKQIRFR